jgi:bifunctional aspartokinase / homoserine dehydrogenase 1
MELAYFGAKVIHPQTNNVVSFTTSRYNRNPLVVRGPGARPAVTAGGVFADLLRVCAYLGSRL